MGADEYAEENAAPETDAPASSRGAGVEPGADGAAAGEAWLPPPERTAWAEAEARATERVRQATGADLTGHLVRALAARPGVQVLAVGASAGAVVLELAQHAPGTELVCIHDDAAPLRAGRQRARELAVDAQFVEADLNRLELERGAFDLVFCHAVLHRVVALEALADQIKHALRPDGAFIAIDVVTCNGYGMWPETRDIARAIWHTLPAKFRLNHVAYPTPLLDDEIWEPAPAHAGSSRPQDILPALEGRFAAAAFVPYFSLGRRFFDAMYGPNFDMTAPLDRAIFEWIWQLDVHYLATGRLRPETFFAIYRTA